MAGLSRDAMQQPTISSHDSSDIEHTAGDTHNNGTSHQISSTYGSFPAIDAHTVDIGTSSSERGQDQDGHNSSSASTAVKATTASASSTKSPGTRAIAPDLLRGLLMALMALDHDVVTLHPWAHETAPGGERDSTPVDQWNRPMGFTIRMLTHLCAPGFTFLLGLGVLYLGRSRSAMGWSSLKLLRYFFVRAMVLILLEEVFGLALTGGKIWFLNFVLFQLAVDYFLVAVLWLVMQKTERWAAQVVLRALQKEEEVLEDLTENRPLIAGRPEDNISERRILRAASISWHAHNAVLVVLAVITIWWNFWLSPTHGHCQVKTSLDAASSTATTISTSSSLWDSDWIRIWFYIVANERVLSMFAPMTWISFSILGLLYGRIITARQWSKQTLALGNATAGLSFLLLFVMTRLLRFGNLSEDCLHMPEQVTHPDRNQYLASVPSFFYLIKYPPDVAYMAYSLGANFLLLAAFGLVTPAMVSSRVAGNVIFKPLLAYGTSALYFYFSHLLLLFGFGSLLLKFIGHPTGKKSLFNGGEEIGTESLWAYWGLWLVVIAVLYPACRAYGTFKRSKGPDSLWRFF